MFCILFCVLASCKHVEEANTDDVGVKQIKLKEAAGYNVQLGMAYLKQNDLPRAKRKLLHAVEQGPDMPDAHAAMGYYLEKTGDIAQARKFFQKALELAPNSGAQMNNYGTFLCRQGDYVQAERYFMMASKDVHYENTASAYENAGICAVASHDDTKAAHYFTQALQNDAMRSQSLYELVKIDLKNKEYQTALNNLQKFPAITLSNKILLKLASKAANTLGDDKLVDEYNAQLRSMENKTGVNNEYNSNTG